VNALQHLCRVWVAEGELDRAQSKASLAVELEVAGQERWVADGQQILASIHSLRAEWDTARAYVGQALAIRRRVGDMGGIVESLVALGAIDQHVGDWAKAMQRYAEAVALAEQIHEGPPLVMAKRHLGRLALLLGDRAAAAEAIQTALDLAELMPESLEHAPTLLAMAEWCLEEGNPTQALMFSERALDHAKPLESLIEAEIVMTRVYLALNCPIQASAHASEAAARAEALGAPRLLALAHGVSPTSTRPGDRRGPARELGNQYLWTPRWH
jgi:tetratricopeptide (TPR) repeat protein